MRFRASEIAAAVGGRLIGPDVDVDGASFDSRSLVAGNLFVPVVAERDGHDFIAVALDNGATAYLTAKPPVDRRGAAIEVTDTAEAFVRLGRAARGRLPDRVVGITGSVGKTSVKDLTAAALSTRWRTTANEKSYNNELGLPQTLVNAPNDTEVTVLEMGMRGFGEIRRLCDIGRPTIGIVTAVADAHTARLGGIDGVAKAKGELIESLPASGIAILNADQPLVAMMAARTNGRVVTFGVDAGDVRVTSLVLDDRARPSFRLSTPWGEQAVSMSATGQHNAVNGAAAVAAALCLDVPLAAAIDGIEQATLSPWRMELSQAASGALVLNDAYNANPASMRAALDALVALGGGRKIAVVGLMAEIEHPAVEHRLIAAHCRDVGVELIVVETDLYGVIPVGDIDAAIGAVGAIGPGDAVLVKASRVVGLERLARRLLT